MDDTTQGRPRPLVPALRDLVLREASGTIGGAGLLVLRVGFGLMMAQHGLSKLIRFGEFVGAFGDPIGIGSGPSLVLSIFAELFCSILLVAGAATRLAAVPLIIDMAVAGFIVHAADPFMRKELAFVYLIAFVALLILGAGSYSVDGLLRRRPSQR